MIESRQSDFFRSAVESISSFVPEGNFRFSDKGISFKSIDPSQVVLVDFFVDKKYFDKYVIEPNFIGVDLVELNKILQRALPHDKLIISISDAEIKIIFESELKRNFRLPLIDVSSDEAKSPEISYDARIEINASSLKEILKDASLFGSSIVLKVINGKFFIESRGSSGVMDAEASKVSNISSKNEVNAKFSLSFFQSIIKQAPLDSQVTIELKNDSAMRVTYSIGPSKMVFYLAHMIL
ncbi:MAG: hypothetical protein PHY04_02830 [Candidatus ainarchaeum sp.]|jgi:proliferating cell nuclear antigen|nr:hypothetical protein [Candidatus ainarchaeum sp.]MDD3085997.1 hypothetical protein [Candidatus ainarchaeum sp.]MDD4128644.1 hypothetical protein [Candidatus ainarchaeum sp.]HPM85847.1 hypothetical protein [archaeon]